MIRAKNASPVKPVKEKEAPEDEYLLVDGYNIIFAWEELSDLAAVSIDAARYKLMDILSNYQGFRKICVIVVFDAYKVPGGVEKVQKYHNINVVYTKEAETADQYIEKVAIPIGRRYLRRRDPAHYPQSGLYPLVREGFPRGDRACRKADLRRKGKAHRQCKKLSVRACRRGDTEVFRGSTTGKKS